MRRAGRAILRWTALRLAVLRLAVLRWTVLAGFVFTVLVGCSSPASSALRQEAETAGSVRILVELDVPTQPEGFLSAASIDSQRARIAATQTLVTQALPDAGAVTHAYGIVPILAVTANVKTLDALSNLPQVRRILPDGRRGLFLNDSIGHIGADTARDTNGLDGAGFAVAIIDTGVQVDHPMFEGKEALEACFAPDGTCPNGTSFQEGPGAAADMNGHGTHVAATAVGIDVVTSSGPIRGVAPAADLLAVNVFEASGYTYDSAILQGLEWVYQQRNLMDIASVNLSLGGGSSTSVCATSLDGIFQTLQSVGITPVVASGNDGLQDAISWPACSAYAVSVTATTIAGTESVAWYANTSPLVDLAAPGTDILAAYPTDRYASLSGTSMATPHVAGAFALARQAGVVDVLGELQRLADPIMDRGSSFDRIQLANLQGAQDGVNLTFAGALTLSPTDPDANEPLEVCVSWTNNGTQAIMDTFVQARGTWESNGAITNDAALTVNGFAAGRTVEGCYPVSSSISTGVHRVTFTLDPNGSVTETNETDNVRSISFTVVEAAANDDFADRESLLGVSGTDVASNQFATREAGEPTHHDYTTAEATLWWTWTAPASGPVTFHTAGSDFDTVLAVYTGSSLSNLNLVVRNDDVLSDLIDLTSEVQFTAQEGVTYQIAVGGFPWSQYSSYSSTGTIILTWELSTVDLTCDVKAFELRELGDVDRDGRVTEADALWIFDVVNGERPEPQASSDLARHANLVYTGLSDVIDTLDVEEVLAKAIDPNFAPALHVWPETLELDVGEVGCFLVGNAGGGTLNFDSVAGSTSTQNDSIVFDVVDTFGSLDSGRAIAVMLLDPTDVTDVRFSLDGVYPVTNYQVLYRPSPSSSASSTWKLDLVVPKAE